MIAMMFDNDNKYPEAYAKWRVKSHTQQWLILSRCWDQHGQFGLKTWTSGFASELTISFFADEDVDDRYRQTGSRADWAQAASRW